MCELHFLPFFFFSVRALRRCKLGICSQSAGIHEAQNRQNFLWVAHTQHHVCVPGQNKNKANLRLHSNILAHGRAVV